MFRILLFLLSGIGAGYLLRRRPVARLSGYGTRAAVVALLFVFGASIGANRELIASLSRFGLQAVAFALLGVAGSLCAVRVARRLLTRKGGAR
ncbi:LysO family transporter [uncultured Alistipes sp.]|uniref:LysO family transporter n=1 Tax=uncultured Alistipes sp. TaxID=538949 RepID=UPI0025D10994|nr:LysO family transporter [uncultured Alistipes sp.]